MSLQQEVEFLRNIPLFSKVDPTKLKLLAFASERLAYNDDQILFHQGDNGDAAFIIMEGNAAVLIDTENGAIEVARLKKGDVVGEIAILCNVPRTATVQAKGQLTTLKVKEDTFFQLVTEFPQIAVEIMRELAARLERTNAQLRDALNKKAS
ncbi:MAG: cyclic nucleotide-binding protein [Rhodospirillaceae bacterium]|nr:cyclic nucleotide-binding protein [Rhodospirillaceae bacterium]